MRKTISAATEKAKADAVSYDNAYASYKRNTKNENFFLTGLGLKWKQSQAYKSNELKNYLGKRGGY
jgi:hypothetical protein